MMIDGRSLLSVEAGIACCVAAAVLLAEVPTGPPVRIGGDVA
jgi:hypothetical protein